MYKLSCEMSAKASIIWLDKTNSQYCLWLVDPLSLSHSCERSLLQNSHTITHIKIAFITRKVKYTSYEHEIFCAHRFLGSTKHTTCFFQNLHKSLTICTIEFTWFLLVVAPHKAYCTTDDVTLFKPKFETLVQRAAKTIYYCKCSQATLTSFCYFVVPPLSCIKTF